MLEEPVENVLIQVYTHLSRKGEVVRRTCFTMQAAMLLSVTTLTQREHDRLDTMACHSVFYIILRAASVIFLGVGPLRPELQSGLQRTTEKARGHVIKVVYRRLNTL